MEVETYEVEQAASTATVMAQDGEALDLINKLGLTGQKRVINPTTGTRNPYRVMNAQERLVYGALMTEKTELADYDADAIPLRVLQVAAHAKGTGLFVRLEIWHSKSALIQDPILIGHVTRKSICGYDETVLHILARWGKALLPLEQMEAHAVTECRRKKLDSLRTIAVEVANLTPLVEVTNDLGMLSKTARFYES